MQEGTRTLHTSIIIKCTYNIGFVNKSPCLDMGGLSRGPIRCFEYEGEKQFLVQPINQQVQVNSDMVEVYSMEDANICVLVMKYRLS